MIPASQASLRAWSAVTGSPVSSRRRGVAVAEQVVQGHGDHHGGVDAAGLGEPVGGVAGDVLAERVPQPFRGAGVLPVLGGGVDREHRLLQHGTDRGRQGEPAVAQPVPVVGDREPARLLGQRLLALQGLELVGFGDLGGDHLEHPVREPAKRDRVVLPGQADQMGLGVAAVLDRQRVHTLHDHRCLFLGDLSGGHRLPDRLVVVVQGVRELQPAFGVAFGLPGLVGPVAARVGGTCGGSEIEAVGLVGDPELELAQLVPQRGHRGDGVASSVALIDHSRGSPSWSRSAWNRAARTATGCASGVPNTVAIQGILASGTDTPGPRMRAFPASVEKHFQSFWSGDVDGLDTRSLALAARPPAR